MSHSCHSDPPRDTHDNNIWCAYAVAFLTPPHPLRTRTRNSIRHEIRTVARHPDNFTHIFIYYLCAKGAKSGARGTVCECDKREAIRLREPASRRVASKQNHASARNSHARTYQIVYVACAHIHTCTSVHSPYARRVYALCGRITPQWRERSLRSYGGGSSEQNYPLYGVQYQDSGWTTLPHVRNLSLSLARAHTRTHSWHIQTFIYCARIKLHISCVCVCFCVYSTQSYRPIGPHRILNDCWCCWCCLLLYAVLCVCLCVCRAQPTPGH